MEIQPSAPVTLQNLGTLLDSEMPHYKIDFKKTILGDEYVQVSKSSFVGARVKVNEDNTVVINGVIPSLWIRGALGGWLIYAMTYPSRKKIENEVGNMLSGKLA